MNTKDVSANLVRLLLGVLGAGTVGAHSKLRKRQTIFLPGRFSTRERK
jgi:hypothetical protein